MNSSFKRRLIIILLIIHYTAIIAVVMNTGIGDLTSGALRLCGLLGFLSLSLGAIITLLKSEIKRVLGKPFIKIHHVFVITGLVLITIHPVILALAVGNPFIFIPDTSSISAFLVNGGRIAIILIYAGLLAWIFRSTLKGRWVQIHRIMYGALLLGIIHANLLGEDFTNPLIRILYNCIAGTVLLTGLIKVEYWYRRNYLKH